MYAKACPRELCGRAYVHNYLTYCIFRCRVWRSHTLSKMGVASPDAAWCYGRKYSGGCVWLLRRGGEEWGRVAASWVLLLPLPLPHALTFPGEASWESALPTSLLACPSGGWPLSLLKVCILGSVQVYDTKGWQYMVVKKRISSSFQMTVVLLREVVRT